MVVPRITRYRIEEVEVPAPKTEQQITEEVLGIRPIAPVGPPTRRLRISLEGADFPMTEMPFSISIGDQTLTGLASSMDGTDASGFIERVPEEGDAISFDFPAEADGPRLAANFQRAKLDTAIA